jgi:hypothetical protein
MPDHVVGYLNGGKHWGRLDHPDVAKGYALETRQQADELFASSLRALADQWIDSGKDSKDIEEPLTRNVNKIPPGYAEPLFDVLSAWLGRNMPKPALMRTGKIAIIVQSPNLATLDPQFYARECAIYWFKELLDSPGLTGSHGARILPATPITSAVAFVRSRSSAALTATTVSESAQPSAPGLAENLANSGSLT